MFDPSHARDVSLPTATCLQADLFPQAEGQTRDEIVTYIAAHVEAAILAYFEFQPVRLLPEPSLN